MEKTIALLRDVSRKYPELRLGQIISNAAQLGGWKSNDVFYCDNATIEKGLQELLKRG